MDRQGARRTFLKAALLTLASAGLIAAAAAVLPLRAARWLAPGVDVVEALGREPAECLEPVSGMLNHPNPLIPSAVEGREDQCASLDCARDERLRGMGDSSPVRTDPALRTSIAIGRAAFRTPLLLGGQAARAGLSCNSCHVNGHDNPHFVFPGLSGAPGTADVTSSLMSRLRGDGTINPKPIPSLYTPPRLAPHDRATRALEAFIRGLVVEEFDGEAPPPAVLNGLADYIRALSPACGKANATITLAGRLADVRAAAASAGTALGSDDTATARLMIFAARDALGQVAERFPGGAFANQNARLRAADLELAAILPLLTADPEQARERLAAWRVPALEDADGSLFDHHRLANWGGRR